MSLHKKETYQKQYRNITFYNLKLLNKNIGVVSQTLILGAHEAIPCASEFSFFLTLAAHDHCSWAFSDFEISDYGLFPICIYFFYPPPF